MKKGVKILFLIMILIISFIAIYLLNSNTSLVTDDFPYQYVFKGRMPSPTTEKLTRPIQLFESMANHWRLWGGRITVHFFLQFAFMIGINFFNIINSIMFLLLGFLIYKHINIKNDINLVLLVLIYCVIFLFCPQPGATLFWKSGSANYLWSSVLILLMTLIFTYHFYDKNYVKDTLINTILLFILGIIIGCANENSSCALMIAMILFILAYKIKFDKIPKWSITALVGVIISYIVLLISPGNYIRAREMYPDSAYNFGDIIGNLLKITRLSYDYLGLIFIIAIVTTVLAYTHRKDIESVINHYGLQIIFSVYILASIYSLVFSPAFPERCWMFAFVYLLIIIGININVLSEKKKYKIIIQKCLVILMLVSAFKAIGEFYLAYQDIVNTKQSIIKIEDYIMEQKKNGEDKIVIKNTPVAMRKYNAFTYNGYLTYTPNSWTNRWIAYYYGVKSIRIED